MTGFGQLIHEIHRRSLWQVVGVYLTASWVALQVVETLTDSVGLPEWVPGAAIAIFVIGFPLVVATAFVQHGHADPDAGPGPEPSASVESHASAVEPGAAVAHGPVPVGTPSRTPHLLTWRNAAWSGVGAFTLLGLITASFLGMRSLGIGPAGSLVARGVLDAEEELVLADFQSFTDTTLARTVTEGLRRALAESSVLRFMDPSAIEVTLRRMERDPYGTAIDRPTAREIATREGLKGFVAGVVDKVGTGYLLSADLVIAESGDIVLSHHETASDDSELIPAIDQLARRFRKRAGESLRDVNASPRLSRATTSSLDALKLYVEGSWAENVEGDRARAMRLLQEAVAIDSTFAHAWRKLGALHYNLGEQTRHLEAAAAAVRHSSGLPEHERADLRAYYAYAIRDFETTIAEYRRAIELSPDSSGTWANLAIAYEQLRRFEEAEHVTDLNFEMVEARGGTVTNWISHQNRIREKYALGKRHEAVAALAEARAANRDSARWDFVALRLAQADGDFGRADSLAVALADPYWLANLAWMRGRLREAEDHYRRLMAGQAERGFGRWYLVNATELVRLRADGGDREGGLAILEEALAHFPIDSIDRADRPYFDVAAAFARGGRPDEARRWLRTWAEEVPPELRRDPKGAGAAWAEAELALSEGRAAEALTQFLEWDTKAQFMCPICLLDEIGLAYDRASVGDSAIAVYERYLETPWWSRLYDDARARGPILERLGQLHEERENLEKAALYTAQFIELWADADPILQPRVQAARERLEAIRARSG